MGKNFNDYTNAPGWAGRSAPRNSRTLRVVRAQTLQGGVTGLNQDPLCTGGMVVFPSALAFGVIPLF